MVSAQSRSKTRKHPGLTYDKKISRLNWYNLQRDELNRKGTICFLIHHKIDLLRRHVIQYLAPGMRVRRKQCDNYTVCVHTGN